MRDHHTAKPRSLDDFPLHAGEPDGFPEGAAGAERSVPRGSGTIAPLAARCSAAAADAAAVLLIAALAILTARLFTGRSPAFPGMLWAGAFLLLLSLCATVPALLLFGKTVGMALAELSTPSGAAGSRVSSAAAFRRWVGTLATAATAGLALLWTIRSPESPTPADRLSGHPLTLE